MNDDRFVTEDPPENCPHHFCYGPEALYVAPSIFMGGHWRRMCADNKSTGAIYLFIAARMWKIHRQGYNLKIREISETLGVSEATVKKSLRWLRDNGYINKRDRRMDPDYKFDILPLPQFIPGADA